MSRILRRPMFRGGGKVSSYGNGIASGLGYAGGGRVNLNIGGSPFGAPIIKVPQATPPVTGGNILSRNLNKLIPTKSGILNTLSKGAKLPLIGAAGTYGAAAGVGTGIGQLADFYAKSTSTPEGYRRLKEMGGPKMTFDETNIDVGQDLDYIAQGNMTGEKPGFFPRGGKAKFYEDRGYNPDGTLIKTLEDQLKKDPALETAGNNPNKEFNVNDEGEPILTKKERLEKAAKEYEDILGAGIKKDSIFDAMVEGGTRLLAGEGYAAALNAANKELDPIQNIKTASRKLALEEDIAIRKAQAVAASKQTEFTRRAAAMRAAGRSDEDIARMAEGLKPKDKADYISDANNSVTTGLTLWVKDNVPNLKSLVDKKVDPSTLEDGIHYIPELFTLITIKDKVIEKSERLK